MDILDYAAAPTHSNPCGEYVDQDRPRLTSKASQAIAEEDPDITHSDGSTFCDGTGYA